MNSKLIKSMNSIYHRTQQRAENTMPTVEHQVMNRKYLNNLKPCNVSEDHDLFSCLSSKCIAYFYSSQFKFFAFNHMNPRR